MIRGLGSILVEPDPEIERTLHQRRTEHQRVPSEESTTEMAEPQRTMMDYAKLSFDDTNSSITRPVVAANTFEIKPAIIQIIQNTVQFGVLPNEDPNAHLASFLEICDTFKANGVSNDAIRLRLFPFSLRDRAKGWLNTLSSGSISTWDGLAEKFLTKYFPPSKTAKLRNDISTYTQLETESLYEAWERYKDLLRRCPHHGLPTWLQVQTFYNGLIHGHKAMIDTPAGGTLKNKTPEAAYELIDEMATNSYQWQVDRATTKRQAGVHNVDAATALAAQIELLNKKIDGMSVGTVMSCELCGTPGHKSVDCQAGNPFAQLIEQVDYAGNFQRPQQNNPYSNTYNPGWRNHPNFSWSNQQNPRPPPPGYNQTHPQQP